MPNTYELIKGETLTGSAASYTFSAIPSTFSDLVLKVSARTDVNANDQIILQINSDTGTNYSKTRLYGGTYEVDKSDSIVEKACARRCYIF